jgi:hypothetical protein
MNKLRKLQAVLHRSVETAGVLSKFVPNLPRCGLSRPWMDDLVKTGELPFITVQACSPSTVGKTIGGLIPFNSDSDRQSSWCYAPP